MWMSLITGITCRTLALLEGEACWLVMFSGQHGRVGTLSLSFGFTLLVRIVLHSTPWSSRALTFRCPLYTISSVSSICPWLQQRQRRTFQVVFHKKINASHELSVSARGHHRFQSGAVSRLALF